MKRWVLFILLFFSCSFFPFAMPEGKDPQMITVTCNGYNQEDLFYTICRYMVDSLHAEVRFKDYDILLSYIETRPQNCVGVVYTVKFAIEDNQYSFSTYYAIAPRDNKPECLSDIENEMKRINHKVRNILKVEK